MRSLLRLLASVALAAGLIVPAATAENGPHVAWNDCVGAGQSYETFACNTNVGAHTLVGSFSSANPIDQFAGIEATLRFVATQPTLPSWWQVRGSGQCRDLAANSNADFVAGPFNCFDYWEGQASGGITNLDVDYYGPGTARFQLVYAVPTSLATLLPAGLETYAYKLIIRNIKTVGTACTGCDAPIGIVVGSYKLIQPYGGPGPDIILYNDGGPFESVGWQCPGKYSCGDGPGGTCVWLADCPTESGRRTWGAVKSLYR